MHLTTSGQTITRAWVKLPLERECFYLLANGTLTPVDDRTFHEGPAQTRPHHHQLPGE